MATLIGSARSSVEMTRVLHYGRALAELAGDYVASTRALRTGALELGTVQAYVMFVGYPRSGHSIIGALLDAHPDAILEDRIASRAHLKGYGFET